MKTLVKNQTNNNNTNRSTAMACNPLDRFFRNDFFDVWDGGREIDMIPSINVVEEKDKFKIEMAAPGLKKEDFNIDVEGDLVTISSEKESESTDGQSGNGKEDGKENGSRNGSRNGGYTRREYNYSSFSRSFNIPEHADASKIKAKYTDGILSLDIPKRPESQTAKSQKIAIE